MDKFTTWFVTAVLALPMFSFGAVQATRKYCDDNKDKAVAESLNKIGDYLTEHNIPTEKTNNFYEVRNITNNFYEVKYLTNDVTIYETTNHVENFYTTNYSTFVTAVQEETNTQFVVWSDDMLTIEKDGKQIWREKDVNDVNETVIKTYMDTKINPVLDDVGTWMEDSEKEIKSYIDEGTASINAFLYETNTLFLIGKDLDNKYNPTYYYSNDLFQVDSKFAIYKRDNNGVYKEEYSSRKDILSYLNYYSATNTMKADIMSVVSNVSGEVAEKADKAWGKYTSAGGEAPSNTVYMTAPNTVFAGGMEYQRVAVGEGSVCVLVTKGAPVWTQGDEGVFKFQDDGGTNYFGFAKTDSYTVGADTDGISVADNIVTLTYNITMSGVPVIWYTPSIDTQPIAWEQLNLSDGTAVDGASKAVSWEASPDAGTEVCYINCSEAQGFFKATIEVAGSAKFLTNMPADFMNGIIATNETDKTISFVKPVVRNGTVIWEIIK